jgi:hypothetical protein
MYEIYILLVYIDYVECMLFEIKVCFNAESKDQSCWSWKVRLI